MKSSEINTKIIRKSNFVSWIYRSQVENIYRFVSIRVYDVEAVEESVAQAFLHFLCEVLRGEEISDVATFLEATALRCAWDHSSLSRRSLTDLTVIDEVLSENLVLPYVSCALFRKLSILLTDAEAEAILLVCFLGAHPIWLKDSESRILISSGMQTLRACEPS